MLSTRGSPESGITVSICVYNCDGSAIVYIHSEFVDASLRTDSTTIFKWSAWARRLVKLPAARVLDRHALRLVCIDSHLD